MNMRRIGAPSLWHILYAVTMSVNGAIGRVTHKQVDSRVARVRRAMRGAYRGRGPIGFIIMLLLFFASGCFDYAGLSNGDLAAPVDLTPPVDMTLVDLTPPLDFTLPPDLTPAVPRFAPDIQSDIDRLNCASSSCHGVTPGLYMPILQAMPGTAVEQQNYTNLLVDIMDAPNEAMSLILTKNLAGNGVTHAGSANIKPFADTNDPTYQKWLHWLANKHPYQ